MGRLKTIEIEIVTNGYVVEDFWNEKVFCKETSDVIKVVKEIFKKIHR